jgi:hypothetical protein
MGPSRNFSDKFWIWRRGYEARLEPKPALTFAGVKLGGADISERMQIDAGDECIRRRLESDAGRNGVSECRLLAGHRKVCVRRESRTTSPSSSDVIGE